MHAAITASGFGGARRLLVALSAALAVVLALLFPSRASADVKLPPFEHWCTDLAGKLSEAQRDDLDARLRAFDKATGNQLVVVIVPSLDGESAADLGYRIGKTWGVGQKGKDNGVVMLVAIAERRVRIEVGKGLEGQLTDLESNDIIRGVIAPITKGRDDRWYQGISAGVDAIETKLSGHVYGADGVARGPSQGEDRGDGGMGIALTILLFLVIGGLLLRSWLGGGRGGGGGFWYGGGGFGGGGWGGGGFGGGDGGGPSGGGGDFGGGGSDDSV